MDSNSDFELGIKSQQEQSKVHKEEEVAEQMDRISDLPDHIIAQVLSFLKTKEAIKTCILSSRWRYIWKEIPRISLDGYKSDPDNFVNLVEHVLKNCSSTKFVAFELYCPSTTDITRLSSLIQCIFSRNIEELIIYTREQKFHNFLLPKTPLPKCTLSCTALVMLKLDYFDIQIPDSIVSFPHLQSIDIGLIFPNFGAVNRLLRCCPVLKELFLFGFLDSPERLKIDISVSTLKHLKLLMVANGDTSKENECNIIINTPNLKYLFINDYSDAQYVVKDLPRLENVDITYDGIWDGSLVVDKVHLLKLLTGISATEGLNLQWRTLDVLESALDYTWPTFPHLKKLIMNLSAISGWTCLSKMLYSAPCLEVLSLDLFRISAGHLSQNTCPWTLPDSVPNCVSEHLKVIVFQSFIEFKDTLQVVEYFLSNAQVLELLVIDYIQNIVDDEVVKKLQMFPKASQTCYLQINSRQI